MRLLLTFLFLSIVFFYSCKNQSGYNKENVNIKIERFDRELFGINTDSLPASITSLTKKYDDFLDAFSYHVIGIGTPASRDYQSFLLLFLYDRLNREVYEETQKIFPDLNQTEKELSKALSIYKSEFPNKKIPKFVAYVSRFNNPYFTVGDYVGIGLDRYFGINSIYYKKLEIPQYTKANMFPEKIASDVIHVMAADIFPFNDSVDNVLSHMIHEGKLMYFTKALLKNEPDTLIIGYSKKQMKWVKENEEQMWTYLVEKKILFSREGLDIRKLTGPAPFTYYFSNESPGQAGIYIGWSIFNEYARHNKNLSLAQLMAETDYEKILRLSKYNP